MINRRSTNTRLMNNTLTTLSEQELRTIASELIEIFADLQRKRIAHRNIKPANIVMMDSKSHQNKRLRLCNFELAFEIPENSSNLIDLQVDACSIIYASPLILDYFTSSASP